MDKLDKTLHILLSESSVYDNMPLPNNQHDKRNLLRALLNIRPSRPISWEFLAAQNAELQMQLAKKGVVTVSQTEPCGCDERVGCGREILHGCKWMPLSMPPMPPCWDVSFRCTNVLTMPFILLPESNCG